MECLDALLNASGEERGHGGLSTQNRNAKVCGGHSAVECLPIKTRALGSIPSTENCRQGSGLARGPPEGVSTT